MVIFLIEMVVMIEFLLFISVKMPFCENIRFFVSGRYLLQQDTDASIDATCGIQAIKKNKYFHQYSLICCENVCVV